MVLVLLSRGYSFSQASTHSTLTPIGPGKPSTLSLIFFDARRPPPNIPHLSALLTELQTFVLPTLQQEISSPAEFFLLYLRTPSAHFLKPFTVWKSPPRGWRLVPGSSALRCSLFTSPMAWGCDASVPKMSPTTAMSWKLLACGMIVLSILRMPCHSFLRTVHRSYGQTPAPAPVAAREIFTTQVWSTTGCILGTCTLEDGTAWKLARTQYRWQSRLTIGLQSTLTCPWSLLAPANT